MNVTFVRVSNWFSKVSNLESNLSSWANVYTKTTNKQTSKVMIQGYKVQLRYIRTTHTHIIRAYFAYTRMSIRALKRVYMGIYVSVMHMKHCRSNKRHLFLSNWRSLQSAICILLKRHADEWKLSYFKFLITLQIHRQTTVSLTLAWS